MRHNFRELQIWKDGMDHTVLTYRYCQNFPRTALLGIAAQMKRAAISIPSNTAEGCGRGSDAQSVHFLDIFLGSACALETQVIIAQRLKFLLVQDADNWIHALQSEQKPIRSLRDKIQNGML